MGRYSWSASPSQNPLSSLEGPISIVTHKGTAGARARNVRIVLADVVPDLCPTDSTFCLPTRQRPIFCLLAPCYYRLPAASSHQATYSLSWAGIDLGVLGLVLCHLPTGFFAVSLRRHETQSKTTPSTRSPSSHSLAHSPSSQTILSLRFGCVSWLHPPPPFWSTIAKQISVYDPAQACAHSVQSRLVVRPTNPRSFPPSTTSSALVPPLLGHRH